MITSLKKGWWKLALRIHCDFVQVDGSRLTLMAVESISPSFVKSDDLQIHGGRTDEKERRSLKKHFFDLLLSFCN